MPIAYDADGNELGEFIDPSGWRDQLEAANKSLRESEAARVKAEADLAPIKAAERERAVNDALGGLGPQAVKVWLRVQPDADLTPAAITAFAEEFDFAPKEVASDATPAAAEPAQPSYTPVATGTATTATPLITEQQLRELYMTNRAEADKRVRARQVRWNHQQTADLVERMLAK